MTFHVNCLFADNSHDDETSSLIFPEKREQISYAAVVVGTKHCWLALKELKENAAEDKITATWDFQQSGMCNKQRLRPACAYPQSGQSQCLSLEYSMTVKLLTEQHLEFLSLKGGCAGSSESTLVKMSHCLKSHVAAQIKVTDKAPNFLMPLIILYNTLPTSVVCLLL